MNVWREKTNLKPFSVVHFQNWIFGLSSVKPVLCPDVSICDVPAPVCGYIGSQEIRTYNSECELYVLACKEAKTPIKLNDGECDTETGESVEQSFKIIFIFQNRVCKHANWDIRFNF